MKDGEDSFFEAAKKEHMEKYSEELDESLWEEAMAQTDNDQTRAYYRCLALRAEKEWADISRMSDGELLDYHERRKPYYQDLLIRANEATQEMDRASLQKGGNEKDANKTQLQGMLRRKRSRPTDL